MGKEMGWTVSTLESKAELLPIRAVYSFYKRVLSNFKDFVFYYSLYCAKSLSFDFRSQFNLFLALSPALCIYLQFPYSVSTNCPTFSEFNKLAPILCRIAITMLFYNLIIVECNNDKYE